MPFLEIATFSLPSALLAASANVDRIELCTDRHLGGTTPPASWLIELKSKVKHIPIFVMIRPRGGDFIYSDDEFEDMKSQIREFHTLDADGFVFGLLGDDGWNVEVERTAELVRLAGSKPCTFHRAFDELKDPAKGLEDVIATGCSAILSSGGKANAKEGAEELQRLVKRADGRIAIIPGGGVRSGNIEGTWQVTGADFLHSSAVVGEGEDALVDVEEVKKMKALLQTS